LLANKQSCLKPEEVGHEGLRSSVTSRSADW